MKIPATFATEVFLNACGRISVAQRDIAGDESIVALSRHQAVLVAQELLRLVNDDGNWPDDTSKDAD